MWFHRSTHPSHTRLEDHEYDTWVHKDRWSLSDSWICLGNPFTLLCVLYRQLYTLFINHKPILPCEEYIHRNIESIKSLNISMSTYNPTIGYNWDLHLHFKGSICKKNCQTNTNAYGWWPTRSLIPEPTSWVWDSKSTFRTNRTFNRHATNEKIMNRIELRPHVVQKMVPVKNYLHFLFNFHT